MLGRTHSKAGEDVCSRPHANADHAVDPTEEPAVSAEQEMHGFTLVINFHEDSTHFRRVITEGSISASSSMVG